MYVCVCVCVCVRACVCVCMYVVKLFIKKKFNNYIHPAHWHHG